MVIKRVGPLSCAKIACVIYGIIGIFAGAMVSLSSVAGGPAALGGVSDDPGMRAALGIAAILVAPPLYAIVGFFSTLLFAWVYNALAEVFGGIEVDIQ